MLINGQYKTASPEEADMTWWKAEQKKHKYTHSKYCIYIYIHINIKTLHTKALN